MNVGFRSLRSTDLSVVADIETAVHIEPWSRAQILAVEDLLSGHYAGWVAESGGHVVAYVLAQVISGEMEILTIGVDENMQGQGVASALLKFVFNEMQVQYSDLTACFLEVRVSNAAARALYHTLGFVEVGRRAKYYRHPLSGEREDALILRLNLNTDMYAN